ncbi:hypothetical protein BMG05_01090 [Mycobacterium malmoense]|nr:hypothetical protein BMG05_01090 [Mycobacterium malmoense]
MDLAINAPDLQTARDRALFSAITHQLVTPPAFEQWWVAGLPKWSEVSGPPVMDDADDDK